MTHLPYPDFEECADCLSKVDLLVARETAYRLMQVPYRPLFDGAHALECGWWAKYPNTLCQYYNEIVNECFRRNIFPKYGYAVMEGQPTNPSWLGNAEFHSLHRTNLHYMQPSHYRRFDWEESKQAYKPINSLWGIT